MGKLPPEPVISDEPVHVFGRPRDTESWEPTPHDLIQIERMSSIWVPDKYQASILNVTMDQFDEAKKRDDRIEMSQARGRGKNADKIFQAVWDVAVVQKNPQMLMFILRAQEGWRDTDPPQVNINTFQATLPNVEQAVKILEKFGTKKFQSLPQVKPLE